MAKIKILKNGFTDINSANISDFALHSDYKCQKIALNTSDIMIVPSGSSWLSGAPAITKTIPHNLGYTPIFFPFVQYGGKGYEGTGNANPQITVASSTSDAVGVAFNIYADATNLTVEAWPTGLGTTKYNETFTIQVFFIADEII